MRWIDVKPEAPWIRRTDQGVIFTDEVVAYDIELPQSEKESENEAYEAEEEEEEEEYAREEEDRRSEHGARGGRRVGYGDDDDDDDG
jgi:hypothetical protein